MRGSDQVHSQRNLIRSMLSMLAFFCAAIPGPTIAQANGISATQQNSDSQNPALARRYLAARRDLSSILAVKASLKDIPDDATVDKLVDQMMPSLSQSKQWKPEYKNWPAVKKVLHDDLKQAVDQIIAEQNRAPQQSTLDDAFGVAFSSQITSGDFEKIVDFYESTTGSKFVAMHIKLMAEVPTAMGSLGKEMIDGEKPVTSSVPDHEHLRSVSELFYEYGLSQELTFDPDSEGNRSGMPVVRMMLEMAIRSDFAKCESIWNELAPEIQAQVLAYRKSPTWGVERAALVRGLKASTTLSKQGEVAKRFLAGLEKAWENVQPLLPQ